MIAEVAGIAFGVTVTMTEAPPATVPLAALSVYALAIPAASVAAQSNGCAPELRIVKVFAVAVVPQATSPKSSAPGWTLALLGEPVPETASAVGLVPHMAPVAVIAAELDDSPSLFGVKRATSPARVASGAIATAVGAPVHVTEN